MRAEPLHDQTGDDLSVQPAAATAADDAEVSLAQRQLAAQHLREYAEGVAGASAGSSQQHAGECVPAALAVRDDGAAGLASRHWPSNASAEVVAFVVITMLAAVAGGTVKQQRLVVALT